MIVAVVVVAEIIGKVNTIAVGVDVGAGGVIVLMSSIVIVVVDSIDMPTLAVNSGTPVLPVSSNVTTGVQKGSVAVVVVGKSGVQSGIGIGTGVGASVGISVVVVVSGSGVGASVAGGSVTVVVVVVVGQLGLELCTHAQATCFAVEHSMQFVSTVSCCSTHVFVCKFRFGLLFANVMSPERRFLANDLFGSRLEQRIKMWITRTLK